MKKIVVAMLCGLFLVGCGNRSMTPAEESNAMRVEDFRQRFIFVDGGTRALLIDKETGVQYLCIGNDIQVIVDKSGLPHIANGWRDKD